jgi:Zn finger protein HypA/HybF involved in hydrogenase expression
MSNPKKRKESLCKFCNIKFEYLQTAQKGKYCSVKCQQKYQSDQKVNNWKSGTFDGTKNNGNQLSNSIRTYLLEQADHKCIQCGWNKINPVTNRSPLEIDHIDGDSTNNRPENLRVLCPNCHALTSTYKALNKGKANKKRLRYYKLM